MSAPTAVGRGLLACSVCELVMRAPSGATQAICPRCGARIHSRKPHSLARTWALLISAAVLYLPANIEPVMITTSIFGAQRDTILSGVAYLWTSGSWPLAVLVFFASISVPLLKLLALAFLATSVQRRSTRRPLARTRLYRILEFIGRWSMLDVFVVMVLVALVNLQALANVQAARGVLWFGCVVVLTMLASMSFDPRLIWDAAGENDGRDARRT
ncbi:MAG: paraquat-inducible protein A [Betaproteobacteria bacterium]|jgi:paraquat-inducible protein A|nr:paraquat-inducible protein A [Betaproteobacteria bacterium]